MAEGKIF